MDTLRRQLAPLDMGTLDLESSTVCAFRADYRIAYVNPAWLAFGVANGASADRSRWGLGANVMDVTPAPLRAFYTQLYARALGERLPQEHSYACPSATLERRMRMRVLPCTGDLLVVVHALLVQMEHDVEPRVASEAAYRDQNGLAHQCSHCRRVQRFGEAGRWDWVPEFVTTIPRNTSHGLCEVCLAYHYPE